MSGFIYLASPYSHPQPEIREHRFREVCRAAAWLMMNGDVVFSPIAHSHSVETIGIQAIQSGAFWKRQDVPLLRHAAELVVLMLPGHAESIGLKWEIELAEALHIPVRYLDPADVAA